MAKRRWARIRSDRRPSLRGWAEIVGEIDAGRMRVHLFSESGVCMVRDAEWPRSRLVLVEDGPVWADESEPS
jgi:hypothetical protein